MAYTKFTGWSDTTLPKKMRDALTNIEDGVSQGISDAAAAQSTATAANNTAKAALPKAGGTMSGPINMGSQQITNLAAPGSDATAAANKKYVDDTISPVSTTANAAKSTADAALPKAGGTMSGNINLNSKRITNVPTTPSATTDAVNQAYVDSKVGDATSQLSDYLPLAGGSMTGDITMTNSKKVTGLPTPSANTDAANKKYVDDKVTTVTNLANSASSVASSASTAANAAQTAINNHAADTDNPHEVTYAQTGAAPASHNHSAGNITSGTLPVARGGTGVTSNPSMLVNLESTSADTVFEATPRPGVTGELPVANGGTGATTAAAARTNLGAQATVTGAATTITGSDLTASRALISNGSGKVAVSEITSTELGYLGGVTSNIQTQLNTLSSEKAAKTEVILSSGSQTVSEQQLLQFRKNAQIPFTQWDRNAIFRGKNLGSSVTAAQYAEIQAGTFNDMYLGDYWEIGGVRYRIMHFDYYWQYYDGVSDYVTKHHVTLVPEAHLYTHVMNDTNITTGGYVGSKMYTEGLNSAIATIEAAFPNHVLSVGRLLSNATNSNGEASGWAWYSRKVDLLTEPMVYGTIVWGNSYYGGSGYNIGVEYKQLAAFQLGWPWNMSKTWCWLRDVVSAAYFAGASYNGNAYYNYASIEHGVRPVFSIS